MEIVFNYFYLHLFVVFCIWCFTAFLSTFLLFFLFDDCWNYLLESFYFFIELNIFNLFFCRWFFRKVLFLYTERSNHFDIEFFSKNDIFFKKGFYLEIILIFFRQISKHEHTISNFFLEKRYFLFDTDPNGALPFSVVLLLLLIMGHFNKLMI